MGSLELSPNLAGEKRKEREWLKLEWWRNKGRRGVDGWRKGKVKSSQVSLMRSSSL